MIELKRNGERMTLAETRPQGVGSKTYRPWYRSPIRLFQTNLLEPDADMDVERVLDFIEDMGCNAWLVNGGGILSFEVRGGAAALRRALDRLRLLQLVPSLGGVESGVGVPALTSHRGLTPAERAELGIGDGLVRISVGLEDVEDLLAELERGLAAV